MLCFVTRNLTSPKQTSTNFTRNFTRTSTRSTGAGRAGRSSNSRRFYCNPAELKDCTWRRGAARFLVVKQSFSSGSATEGHRASTILEAHPSTLGARSGGPRSQPAAAHREAPCRHVASGLRSTTTRRPGTRTCQASGHVHAAFRRSPPDLCGSAFCLCEKASRAASGTAALPVTLPSLLPLLHTLISLHRFSLSLRLGTRVSLSFFFFFSLSLLLIALLFQT